MTQPTAETKAQYDKTIDWNMVSWFKKRINETGAKVTAAGVTKENYEMMPGGYKMLTDFYCSVDGLKSYLAAHKVEKAA